MNTGIKSEQDSIDQDPSELTGVHDKSSTRTPESLTASLVDPKDITKNPDFGMSLEDPAYSQQSSQVIGAVYDPSMEILQQQLSETQRYQSIDGGLDLISGGFGGFNDNFNGQNNGYVRDGNTEPGGIGGTLFDATLSKTGQSKQVVTHVILRGERILYTTDIVHDEYEPITKSRITELFGDRGVILFREFDMDRPDEDDYWRVLLYDDDPVPVNGDLIECILQEYPELGCDLYQQSQASMLNDANKEMSLLIASPPNKPAQLTKPSAFMLSGNEKEAAMSRKQELFTAFEQAEYNYYKTKIFYWKDVQGEAQLRRALIHKPVFNTTVKDVLNAVIEEEQRWAVLNARHEPITSDSTAATTDAQITPPNTTSPVPSEPTAATPTPSSTLPTESTTATTTSSTTTSSTSSPPPLSSSPPASEGEQLKQNSYSFTDVENGLVVFRSLSPGADMPFHWLIQGEDEKVSTVGKGVVIMKVIPFRHPTTNTTVINYFVGNKMPNIATASVSARVRLDVPPTAVTFGMIQDAFPGSHRCSALLVWGRPPAPKHEIKREPAQETAPSNLNRPPEVLTEQKIHNIWMLITFKNLNQKVATEGNNVIYVAARLT